MERTKKINRIKEILVFIRNGIAFAFSWLVICIMAVALINGNEVITVSFLCKTFLLCLWGVIAFTISFKNRQIQKKGFIFELSIFYILFIPIEIVMFYFMGVFDTKGSVISWLIFGGIVIAAYVISVLVDTFIMKRDAVIYTEKMNEYVERQKVN